MELENLLKKAFSAGAQSEYDKKHYKGEEITFDVWYNSLDKSLLYIVGKSLKKSIQQDFENWYLSEGYTETERIGVYKNGCNIILYKDLFYKYVNDVKF